MEHCTALHLTTIHDNKDGTTPIGLVFWREMPEEAMREWIDHEQLAALARQWWHSSSYLSSRADGSMMGDEDLVIHAAQEIHETPNKGNRQNKSTQKRLDLMTMSLLLLSKDQKTLTLANSF
jgi:hypothetical protein